ncbi:MAG: hypothetical protein ABI231_04650 [Candidatus Tumulicola sp.]
MRRLVGVVIAGALAVVLAPGVTSASFAPPAVAAFDLRPQVMLRLFGETSDSRASLAAAYGDRTSESPLRDLALLDATTRHPAAAYVRDFEVAATFASARGAAATPVDSPFDLAHAFRSQAAALNAGFAVRSLSPDIDAPASPYEVTRATPAATFTAGEYQPVEPVPLISPQPGTLSFGSLAPDASVAAPGTAMLAFGDGGAPAGASGSAARAPSTLHIGAVQVRTRLESAALAAPSLSDSGYGAGANFDVRAGARNVNVDLSSNYERLTRNDSSAFSLPAAGSASTWELPGADVPLVVPNYADMSKVSVGAAVAVPVVSGLTLNFNYAVDRMYGGYGMPGLTNLDATDNSYGGKLTFEIPHSTSTLSISARQLRYQDNLLPANTFTQTRENVNFTVKF